MNGKRYVDKVKTKYVNVAFVVGCYLRYSNLIRKNVTVKILSIHTVLLFCLVLIVCVCIVCDYG